MITVWNARKSRTRFSPLACPGDEERPQSGKMTYWQASAGNRQLLTFGCNSERILFLTNDAGMLLKKKDRCRKLGGEAAMCMKTHVVSPLRRECC
jgi:hypothetical protein